VTTAAHLLNNGRKREGKSSNRKESQSEIDFLSEIQNKVLNDEISLCRHGNTAVEPRSDQAAQIEPSNRDSHPCNSARKLDDTSPSVARGNYKRTVSPLTRFWYGEIRAKVTMIFPPLQTS
jgi:hypothetical protein